MNDFAKSIGLEEKKRSYPVYQYSIFTKNGRDEQLVIRADTFEELIEAKRNIDKILEKREVAPAQPTKPANKTFVCAKCGQVAEYREGKNDQGKEWRGIFCTDKENCKFVKWL